MFFNIVCAEYYRAQESDNQDLRNDCDINDSTYAEQQRSSTAKECPSNINLSKNFSSISSLTKLRRYPRANGVPWILPLVISQLIEYMVWRLDESTI
jgi:hypothetical protein